MTYWFGKDMVEEMGSWKYVQVNTLYNVHVYCILGSYDCKKYVQCNEAI